MQANTKYRYRLKFSKGRQVKYVGHLDMMVTWTRAFRRAQMPVLYSQGFNPRARIQVAASLPLGYMSQGELMDIFLKESLDPEEILSTVGSTLPAGFKLLSVAQIEAKSPVMQNILRQADYQVAVETDVAAGVLNNRLKDLLAADKVIQTRIRRKKEETYNLRPLLQTLSLESIVAGDVILTMRLSTGQNGNLRPEAVLKALELDDTWFEIERTKLIFNI